MYLHKFKHSNQIHLLKELEITHSFNIGKKQANIKRG